MYKLTFKSFIISLCVWGAVGFVMGTGVLMGPSRWIIDIARSSPDLAKIEGPSIRALILLLIGTSLAVSLFLARTILLAKQKHVRLGIPLLIAVCLISTLYLWFNPKKFGTAEADTRNTSDTFVTGPYPDLAKLKELKKLIQSNLLFVTYANMIKFETIEKYMIKEIKP